MKFKNIFSIILFIISHSIFSQCPGTMAQSYRSKALNAGNGDVNAVGAYTAIATYYAYKCECEHGTNRGPQLINMMNGIVETNNKYYQNKYGSITKVTSCKKIGSNKDNNTKTQKGITYTSQKLEDISRMAFGDDAEITKGLKNYNLGVQLGNNILNSDILSSLNSLNNIFQTFQSKGYSGYSKEQDEYGNWHKGNYVNGYKSGVWLTAEDKNFEKITHIYKWGDQTAQGRNNYYVTMFISAKANDTGHNVLQGASFYLENLDKIMIYNGYQYSASEQFYFKTNNPNYITDGYFDNRQLVAYAKHEDGTEEKTYYDSGNLKYHYTSSKDKATSKWIGHWVAYYDNGQVIFDVKRIGLEPIEPVNIYKPNGKISHTENVIWSTKIIGLGVIGKDKIVRYHTNGKKSFEREIVEISKGKYHVFNNTYDTKGKLVKSTKMRIATYEGDKGFVFKDKHFEKGQYRFYLDEAKIRK